MIQVMSEGVDIQCHTGGFDADYFEEEYFDTSDLFSAIIFTNVTEDVPNKNSINYFPSGNYTIYDLGNKNRIFTIQGEITTSLMSLAKSNVKLCEGSSGSIETDYIPKTSVIFNKVNFIDKMDNPLVTKFELEAIELI
jgi:hypothetical protein